MRVKNINGTTGHDCKCTSWLEHWKNYGGGALPVSCPETNCIESAEVGAHVQKDGTTDNSWYIVPLCKTHNGKLGQSLDVLPVTLVSANVKGTCGKKKHLFVLLSSKDSKA